MVISEQPIFKARKIQNFVISKKVNLKNEIKLIIIIKIKQKQ